MLREARRSGWHMIRMGGVARHSGDWDAKDPRKALPPQCRYGKTQRPWGRVPSDGSRWLLEAAAFRSKRGGRDLPCRRANAEARWGPPMMNSSRTVVP